MSNLVWEFISKKVKWNIASGNWETTACWEVFPISVLVFINWCGVVRGSSTSSPNGRLPLESAQNIPG